MIFADTNVVSETLRKTPDKHVLDWLIRFDADVALPAVTIAEIAFGIHKIRTDQRAARLTRGLEDWRTPIRRPNLSVHRSRRPRIWNDHGRSEQARPASERT